MAEQEKTEDNDKEDAAARLQSEHRSGKRLEARSKEFVRVVGLVVHEDPDIFIQQSYVWKC